MESKCREGLAPACNWRWRSALGIWAGILLFCSCRGLGWLLVPISSAGNSGNIGNKEELGGPVSANTNTNGVKISEISGVFSLGNWRRWRE